LRLIHVTDPHLSSLGHQTFLKLRGKRRSGYLSWQRNRRHIHRPEILETLTRSIEAEDGDQILLTGDLVHIGLESEMVEAAQWLKRLGPPEKVMLIPGNHDNYVRDSLASMLRHWGDYLPDPGPAGSNYTTGYPLVLELGGFSVIALNSSCTTRIFSAAGELGDQQRSDLAHCLQNAHDLHQFTCVLIHHPPFPGMTSRRKALRDDRQLETLLREFPPGLILYGHLHKDLEQVRGKTHTYCTASASSTRGASYRVFDIDRKAHGWNCRMRLMSLPADTPPSGELVVTARASWSVPG